MAGLESPRRRGRGYLARWTDDDAWHSTMKIYRAFKTHGTHPGLRRVAPEVCDERAASGLVRAQLGKME